MTSVRMPDLVRVSTHEWVTGTPSLGSAALIDATGEKFSFVGQVWNKDGTSKDIRKLHFRFGAVTKAGGSGLTASLQNVSTAAGPPMQPDETQDQTVAIAAAGVTANTWYTTGNLSADRTVTFGEFLSVVIEFDGSGRLGADSFMINCPGTAGGAFNDLRGGTALKTGGSWAAIGLANAVILEFSDGTFGGLMPNAPMDSFNTTAFNSGSAADEVALKFTVPAACKVSGGVVTLQVAASADFDVVLYVGTTALATVSVDANQVYAQGSVRQCRFSFPEQTLTAGTTYYLAVKPTTVNNVSVYDIGVNTANHLQSFPGGTTWHFASRVDAGAWTAVTTRVPIGFGIVIDAIDDGNGTGGVTARVIGG